MDYEQGGLSPMLLLPFGGAWSRAGGVLHPQDQARRRHPGAHLHLFID